MTLISHVSRRLQADIETARSYVKLSPHRIINDVPASQCAGRRCRTVTWENYSLHGNEISTVHARQARRFLPYRHIGNVSIADRPRERRNRTYPNRPPTLRHSRRRSKCVLVARLPLLCIHGNRNARAVRAATINMGNKALSTDVTFDSILVEVRTHVRNGIAAELPRAIDLTD